MWAIIGAIIAAIGTYASSEAQRAQKEYESDVARNNAIAKRQQADITDKQTETKRRQKDVEKERIKRRYMAQAGTNRSLLATGNVDLTSGSALDFLEGNYNIYADDMGEVEFAKAQETWLGKRKAQIERWEGDVFESQATFLGKAAGSRGKSILKGVASGISSYGMSKGGSFAQSSGSGSSAISSTDTSWMNNYVSAKGR